MPLRLPEPGTFEDLLEEVRIAPKSLLRVTRYPATEPWWSRNAYRFDGPGVGHPESFGTCYFALDVQTAFSESVVHENSWFVRGYYQLPAAELVGRHVAYFKLPRRSPKTLVLADFTGDALKRLGLNNDISSGDDYRLSQAWAQAVHASSKKWDGIRYVSRQHNTAYAYALFDRCGLQKTTSKPLDGKLLANLCTQFRVKPV